MDIREQIIAAAEELQRSERGQRVSVMLAEFLRGPVSQLDSQHWHSVDVLLRAYRAGYTGSVLDALPESVPGDVL